MPMSLIATDIAHENRVRDKFDLIYVLQRHKCKIGSCKKYDAQGKLQQCRAKVRQLDTKKTRVSCSCRVS